jgi:ABC-type antimicrobial peptide transport system permease subunit
MKAFGMAFLCSLGGYLVGVLLGFGLVHLYSSNRHDKSTEAAMTAFFAVGPAVGVLTFIGALVYLKSRQP